MEFDLTRVKLSNNDLNRKLVLPQNPSKELAEFMGILTGDGYINYYPSQNKYLLEIAGDSYLDKHYLKNHVGVLVKKLFNLESSFFVRRDQKTMYLRLISKGLINYLVGIGFKKGRKGQIGIPSWILSNHDYMVHFLRGFMDTDGSLHSRKGYPIISITSKSEILIKDIFEFIEKEGFSLKNYYKEKKIDKRGYKDSVTYRICLNGHLNFEMWYNLVGFRNDRHKNKLVEMGTLGFEPRI